ncbi:hypothetical protein EI42_06444 [Thermosporothrix hazakensis]|uniref:Uncharacterized protein n=1 Tax=Thermosporothrix hazakensis TaxID=644383 RepID=A0A326TRA4_THEHA|nr:hypothetical protein EI42_06444 [Thermosporothrix hazakensis]
MVLFSSNGASPSKEKAFVLAYPLQRIQHKRVPLRLQAFLLSYQVPVALTFPLPNQGLPKSGRRPLASARGMDGAGSQQRQNVPLRLTEDNHCVRIREDSEDEQGARDADL